MVWLKFLHVAAISLWSAGLICLPGLYVQRTRVPGGEALHRLHALVRFVYVGAMSPAAFVAVASGTGLIFLQQTWAPWFGAKLFCVGMMVVIHVLTGLVVIRLFDEGETYPAWRFLAVTAVTAATVSAVLFLVLAKPVVPVLYPERMREPGSLGRLLADVIPSPRS